MTRSKRRTTTTHRAPTLLAVFAVGLGWAACGDDGAAEHNANQNANQNVNANLNDNLNSNQNGNTNDTPPTHTLADLEGFYYVQELAVPDEEGGDTPITFSRVEQPVNVGESIYQAMVRGHLELVAQTTTEGTALLHTGIVLDRMLVLPSTLEVAATLEPDDGKLVLRAPAANEVAVYVYLMDAGVLTLTLDHGDIRNTYDDYPEGVVAEAAVPTSSEVTGVWSIHTWTWITNPMLDPPETTTFTRECAPLPPEMTYPYGYVSGTYHLAPRGTLDASWVLYTFDTADCSGQPLEAEPLSMSGFYDVDTSAAEASAYVIFEPDRPAEMYMGYDWSYSIDATGLTLTTTGAYHPGPFALYATQVVLTAP